MHRDFLEEDTIDFPTENPWRSAGKGTLRWSRLGVRMAWLQVFVDSAVCVRTGDEVVQGAVFFNVLHVWPGGVNIGLCRKEEWLVVLKIFQILQSCLIMSFFMSK